MTFVPDLSHDIARFAATTRFADLPADAVEAAKKGLLDTLGVALAGSGMEPAVMPLIDHVRSDGGRPDSTILGFGDRVPAARAALANGALAHCLDFDDLSPWGAHPDGSVVPTVLALAERKGGVAGAEILTAIAIGQEVMIRLRLAVGLHMDWNLSTVLGCFAATAAGGAVMGLDAARIAHALGIASTQASGTMEMIFGLGSDLRGMYAGFTSQGSVQAVLLAERGLTGVDGVFEGEAGIFKVYFGGKCDRASVLDGLGERFLSGGMIYKFWPAVGNAHTYIHAAIELMREHPVERSEIDAVRVFVGDFGQRMCTPLDLRQVPRTLVDARFSLPFLVALALCRGRIGVADISATALEDPQVLALARKVAPVDDAEANWTGTLPDGRIEVILRDGRRFERHGGNVPGSKDRPMTWDELGTKFADCARAAIRPLDARRVDTAVALIRGFERCGEVRELIGLLH